MRTRADIHVTGIVQGVGFRPFVFREAVLRRLVGYVLNLGDAGVQILVEGQKAIIEDFIRVIKEHPPSISRVESMNIQWNSYSASFQDFSIVKSSHIRKEGATTEVPPDIAMCDECLSDLTDSSSNWYLYPFTSCAACGPRFSTITGLPYDRPLTTMVDFPLCDICNTSYTNPLDRRYHAQTTACGACGPTYRLLDSEGDILDSNNPIMTAAKLLSKGAILALQGIAGTHLATITSDSSPIRKLRGRKYRPQRPFAVMARDLSAAEEISNPTKEEGELLVSWRRPIVLVQKRETSLVRFGDKLIAPGLDTIGVMLPYAPLHHLLFRYMDESVLVMTSANPTGVPMYVDPSVIVDNLRDVVDYFLVHDRIINQRADDSIIKIVQTGFPVFIRRARGYVPESITIDAKWGALKVLGLGPEEKVTGTILKSNYIYPTQHIGNTNQIENVDFLIDAANHAMYLFGVDSLDGIVCDLHPEFLTSELAERLSYEKEVQLFRVQHHHAHLTSLLVDHNLPLDTSITCITADGYGFGFDGNAWGGEILVGNAKDFTRQGGLAAKSLPGGDMTARFAVRSLVGILGADYSFDELLKLTYNMPMSPDVQVDDDSLSLLLESIENKVNTMTSSSVGRLLDAVTLSLGICYENSYDGECPMKLEAIARPNSHVELHPSFKTEKGMIQFDSTGFLEEILDMKKQGISISDLAYAAQWYLGSVLADMACQISQKVDTEHIGFSGGVALNRIVTKALVEKIRENNLTPLIHRQVPPGDGGISIGQVATAATLLSG